ncbi:MAG: germination protein YpeB, partial [Clostridia bacterium]|nr:germination protein YpeB [Clostridia bacterium]
TSEKIKNAISGELSIKSINKSLILSDSLKEKYCYEVKCKTSDNSDVIVYLNKDTLKEENILFLIHSSKGTLTK